MRLLLTHCLRHTVLISFGCVMHSVPVSLGSAEHLGVMLAQLLGRLQRLKSKVLQCL
jgi:hypothetical protein